MGLGILELELLLRGWVALSLLLITSAAIASISGRRAASSATVDTGADEDAAAAATASENGDDGDAAAAAAAPNSSALVEGDFGDDDCDSGERGDEGRGGGDGCMRASPMTQPGSEGGARSSAYSGDTRE